MENENRVRTIRNQHPDKLYAICRTDNNYWRHYRASPKLGIDELAMMICRDVGCDLTYCQMLYAKPKTPDMQINDCDNQFDNFRSCIIREKRIFRSIVGKVDKSNPTAIVDYLEKHFKDKEARKKERKLMGDDTSHELADKIREMEEKASIDMKKMPVTQYKMKKKQVMEQTYM